MKSNNELATIRSYNYLKILRDKNSISNKKFEDLLESLEGYQNKNKVTIVDLLIRAFSELGYMEKGASYKSADDSEKALYSKDPILDSEGNALSEDEKYNKYADFFDKSPIKYYKGEKQDLDWCSLFVDWLVVTTFGFEEARKITVRPDGRVRGAGVNYASEYYPLGLHLIVNPQNVRIGDQVFFSKNGALVHTGIVVGVYDGFVYTLEGNTNPQVGEDARVVPRGKSVCLKKYSLDRKDIEFCHPLYGIERWPEGFDSQLISKMVAELHDSLKQELENSLPVEEEMTPQEISRKRRILQTCKNLINNLKNDAILEVNTFREEIVGTAIKAKGIIK